MLRLPSLQALRDFDRDFGEVSEILKRLAFRLLVFASSLYGLYRLGEEIFR